jgi:hypothetical protein
LRSVPAPLSAFELTVHVCARAPAAPMTNAARQNTDNDSRLDEGTLNRPIM